MASIGSKHRRRHGGGPSFIMLPRFIKRSQAWHDLSLAARSALIELIDCYSGCNNGMIGLGCRELAKALKSSRDTANRALSELDDAGLVRPITAGVWRGKQATEWRITFLRCDATGELPNKNWKPRSQSDVEDAKVRPEGRKPPLSPTTRPLEPKNPINENALSPTTGTHIDSTIGGKPTKWCRARKRLVTDTGIAVPIVDHPLVGNAAERSTLNKPCDIPELPAFLDRRRV